MDCLGMKASSFMISDIRVAELITAYGRYSLSEMQRIAELNGFEIIGGDTDLKR
jgi:DNA polymerase elongation subunit (family B)